MSEDSLIFVFLALTNTLVGTIGSIAGEYGRKTFYQFNKKGRFQKITECFWNL